MTNDTTGTREPLARQPRPEAETWRESDVLYLLKCYDVWSATPPRGCECGSPIPAQA
jgi:hypothetical protein